MNPAAWAFGTMSKIYPVADLQLTVNGLTVTADTSGSHALDGKPLALFQLTWGDGTQRVQYTPIVESHTYTTNGKMRLQLTVTDSTGLQRVHTQSVGVSGPLPPSPPPQTPPDPPATLQSIVITGPTAATTGQSVTYFATGMFSDGSQQDLSPTATWTSSNTAVATIGAPGLVATLTAGTTSLGASSGGKTATPVTLTVSAPPVVLPTAPGGPSPNNAATNVSLAPTLTWSAQHATSYSLKFGTVNPPTQVFSGLTTASFTPSTLVNSKTYYWQVTAISSSGSTTGAIWSFTTQAIPVPPSTGDPTHDPLIQAENLSLVGSFRVPQGTTGDPSAIGFSFGGGPIAFNPSGPSLFMNGYKNYLAELSIPALVKSTTLGDLNTASFVQTFHDPTEGHYGSATSGTIPSGIGGLLVSGSNLYASGFIYYDADNTTAVSQFTRSKTLSTTSFSGWQALWTPTAGDQANGVPTPAQGYVGGALAAVPSVWQTLLGGTALASSFGLPIIFRESSGPDAIAFNLSDITGSGTAAGTGLLYYPQAHATLGTWDNSTVANPLYNQSTVGNGLVIVPNWRTALYFGRTGTGIPGYGEGTADQTLAGKPTPDGGVYAYDPSDSSKGSHAYPYVYYVWAYDLNDFAAVKAGTKLPYQVVPYASWTLSLPFAQPNCKGLYATVDPSTSRIYLSQVFADPGSGFFSGPIVHAFDLVTAPVVTPPPSGPVTAVHAGADLQKALNAAQPGDTIVLDAGALYTGNYILPVKSGGSTKPITITSNTALPPPGTRVSPTTAANFAKIQAVKGGLSAIATAPSAAYWNLIGLEFLGNPGGFGIIVQLGDGSPAQNSLDLIPHDILIDRCYIHGDPVNGQKVGVTLNASSVTVKNSYISDIKHAGQDSQALAGVNTPGTILIDNNYLEAAAENILFGGDDARIANLVPTNITVTNNYVTKQVAWRTQGWVVKNLFELKNASQVLVENNIFENNWEGGQPGYAIVFTPRNQGGTNTWATVNHVTFRKNIVRHTAGVFNTLGTDNVNPSGTMNNITIQDNLCYDVSKATWGGNGLFYAAQGGDTILVNHNTAITDGSSFLSAGVITTNYVFENNIVFCNLYGIAPSGAFGQGNAAWNHFFPSGLMSDNVIILVASKASNFPTGNYFPTTVGAVGFTNYAGGDYSLTLQSPYITGATDGTRVGYRP